MPIKIQSGLPARKILEEENIFVMTERRATTQDIRPLKIAIVNLMPTKIATETQLLRLLGNTPLQIEVSLVNMESHLAKNVAHDHLRRFYISPADVLRSRYDGMIITGAPVEQIPFEEVDYWKELCAIMDYARRNVFCTLFICWGAQAGLYYHYGLPKVQLQKKFFGVFPYRRALRNDPLMRGFDDCFPCPQSRHTTVRRGDILSRKELVILAESAPGVNTGDEPDVLIARSRSCREIYMTGHLEYDAETLGDEYFRDQERGLPIEVPRDYFPGDDPGNRPASSWRSTAHLFYSNWLNYYVYQETPYEFAIEKG
ncbi:MAG: homoserine O-succinyltransferase [Spirochaetaceae bacterium]|jgi:homoserine O-succinyltransferase|nr:homoserine O-succinyltransferase [Spirochaetaceae bacterium]